MSKVAKSYPTEGQYEYWKKEADEMGLSISTFIQYAVEAGIAKFDGSIEPDHTNAELREQRDDLHQQLSQARERIERLEAELYDSERRQIVQYVSNNPGADFGEIVLHLSEQTPVRANRHLDALTGSDLTKEGDQFFPSEP